MKVKDLRNGMFIAYAEDVLQVISFKANGDDIHAEIKDIKLDVRKNITFHQNELLKVEN